MTEISDVVKTIARQTSALGIKAKAKLQVDENTLRIHQKTRSYVTNTDITYNRGTDTYDVKVCKTDARLEVNGAFNQALGDIVATGEYTDVYVESLADVVGAANTKVSA